jgi:hypothetical protein
VSDGPYDRPTALELLDAVREYLELEVAGNTDGRLAFHARVAANIVALVAREITLGPVHVAAHEHRLQSLGVTSEAELVAAIRSGALDDRMEEVRSAVRATVADKLAVSNPGYLA